MMIVVMAACSAQQQSVSDANSIYVYYINNDETRTESYP